MSGSRKDHAGHRLGRPDPRLGGVDGAGHLGGAVGGRHRDLGRDQQLLGAEVHRPHVDHALHRVVGQQRGLDAGHRLGAGALAEQQALGLDRQHDRDADEQGTDGQRAEAVPDAVAGEQGHPDPDEGEDEADQRREVLEQDDRQLGRLGPPDELHPGQLPRVWFDSWIAVRKL